MNNILQPTAQPNEKPQTRITGSGANILMRDPNVTSMAQVCYCICETYGHKIALLLSPGLTVIDHKEAAMCTACGMTLKEIRGEVKRA